MSDEHWEIIEGSAGWSVYRNNRIMRYDCYDIEEAMRVVKRKSGSGVSVKVYDINDSLTKKVTK
jgi:hypothetical protein